MKWLRASSLHKSNSKALTLVEVVVALVLLSSLLVAMVTGYGAHVRQMRLAHERLAAIDVADQLLAQWYRGSEVRVPRQGQGLFRGPTNYVWQTMPVHRNFIETLPIEVVRLQIFPEEALAKRRESLVQVDVLLNVKE